MDKLITCSYCKAVAVSRIHRCARQQKSLQAIDLLFSNIKRSMNQPNWEAETSKQVETRAYRRTQLAVGMKAMEIEVKEEYR